jgi:peptide/nickel transport system substrate-binding protein
MRGNLIAAPVALAAAAAGCLERGPVEGARAEAAPASLAAPIPALHVRAEPRGPADLSAVIAVRLEAEPAHLNPLLAGDGLAVRVALGDIYEGLLCRDRELAAPRPCLAESVEVSADGRRWRFALRAGVSFHDGAPLAAADVLTSIKLAARSAAPTPLRAELDDLARATADGPIVEVEFARFRPGRAATFARLPILPAARLGGADPAALAAHPLSRRPVGTGPLRLRRWLPGEAIELERHPGYWGLAAGAARVVYRIEPSRDRALRLVGDGTLDLATQIPVADALAAARRGDIDAFRIPRPAYLAAVYNTRRPALATAARRRAATMLLDRGGVAAAVLGGWAAPISGPYLAGEGDPGLAPLPFDPGAAGAALGGERLEILVPAESPAMARIADIWAADAAPALALRPVRVPFATVLDRARAGDFDIAVLAFTTGPELDLFPRLHSSQVGAENYGALRDPALDQLLEAIRAEPDAARRRRLTGRAHGRIDALQPYAFIATDVRAGLVAADIGGVAAGDGLAARLLWRAR